MEGREQKNREQSRIIDLVNRVDDLLGKIGPHPQKRTTAPRSNVETRYSAVPLFALGLKCIPDEVTSSRPPCITMTMRTGKEIMGYATFGRTLWRPPRENNAIVLSFIIHGCPLAQHVCGCRKDFCPLKVGGEFGRSVWYTLIEGYKIPLN